MFTENNINKLKNLNNENVIQQIYCAKNSLYQRKNVVTKSANYILKELC